MKTRSISGTVTVPVVLGAGNYGSQLTITATGAINPSASGATALTAPATLDRARVSNQGVLLGGIGLANSGGDGGIGGAGVMFAAAGALANAGSISGGTGGAGGLVGYTGGDGGTGIDLAGAAAIANSFLVAGGAGGYAFIGGNGGVGLYAGTAASIVNRGTITGGAGGSANLYGYQHGNAGNGGNGIDLSAGGTLVNHGLVTGGGGGGGYFGPGAGGLGIAVGAAASVDNAGTIAAAAGGTAGIQFSNGGTLINRGDVLGGASAVSFIDGGTVSNTGTMTGAAGYTGKFAASQGGTGLSFGGTGTITSLGLIAGGTGAAGSPGQITSGAGGLGVVLSSDATLINRGSILGGISGAAGQATRDGQGGAAVQLSQNGTITNAGTIAGGDSASGGGAQYTSEGGDGILSNSAGFIANSGLIVGGAVGMIASAYANDSPGGIGVDLQQGGTITNTGTIEGAAGGTGGVGMGGYGGDGVFLNGGTLVTSGTVAGGAAGIGQGGAGAVGDAVEFGAHPATLVIDPGAVFLGNVTAAENGSKQNRLELQQRGGTLSGLGTSFTSIATVTETQDARWTLDGAITFAGTLYVGNDGTLTVSTAGSIAILAFAGPGLVQLGNPPALTTAFGNFAAGDVIDLQKLAATSLRYGHGTLTLYTAGNDVADRLQFIGQYTAADFALRADGHGGTDILYAGEDPLASLSMANDFLPTLQHLYIGTATTPDRSLYTLTALPEHAESTPAYPWHAIIRPT